MNKLKTMIQEKKIMRKIVVILVIVAICIVGFFGLRAKSAENSKKSKEDTFEAETIEKRTLTNSISATGTIEANDVYEVETSLMNYEITAVNVKVGDYVKVGDVLCTFDTTSIQDSYNTTQKSIEVGESQNNISEQAAKRSLSYAQDTKQAQSEQADERVSTAENSLTDAKEDYNDMESELNKAKDKVSSSKKAYNKNKKSYEKAQKNYENKNAQVIATNEAIQSAQSRVDELNEKITDTTEETQRNQLTQELNVAKEELLKKEQEASNAALELTQAQIHWG